MSSSLEDFERRRAAMLEGQTQVETLLNFIRERVVMEESYCKSLLRLSKLSLTDGEIQKSFYMLLFVKSANDERHLVCLVLYLVYTL